MDADSDRPRALLERAVELDPKFAKANLQLGSLYFDRGDFTHAAEEFAMVLRLDSGQWEVHYRLANAHRRAGKTEQADEQMRLFVASKKRNSPNNGNGNPASDIHIEQFLSFFDRSASDFTEQQRACAIEN